MPTKPQTRKFGWKPDVPDHRDLEYAKVAVNIPAKLPSSVDLRAKCSAVEDQQTLGSCTANALVGNLEFLLLKNKKPFVDLSRLFVYYNERVLEHSVPLDNGACLRDGIKTLAKEGCCTEKLLGYDISQFAKKPSTACYAEAKTRVITQYARLNTLLDMKTCLAAGYPFVFGFTVYSNFMTAKVAKTGRGDMPGPRDTVQGGHAVCAVGYSDASSRFIIRNSWGPKWGLDGYFTLPYEYVASGGRMSDDFWTIRAGTNL